MGFVRPTAKYSSTLPVCVHIMCPGDNLTDSCVNSVDLCNSNLAQTIDNQGGGNASPDVQEEIADACAGVCAFTSDFYGCLQQCTIDANIASGEIERRDPIVITQAQNTYDSLTKRQQLLLRKAYEENKSKLPHENYKPYSPLYESKSRKVVWVILIALIIAALIFLVNKK